MRHLSRLAVFALAAVTTLLAAASARAVDVTVQEGHPDGAFVSVADVLDPETAFDAAIARGSL